MLVPNKYEKLSTDVFACVCIQQGIIKKCVIDNLKECADRIVNNTLKQSVTEKKTLNEFENIDLSKEFELFLDNYLYFTGMYKDKLDSNIVTAYVTYMLVNNRELKSKSFFDNCLYAKAKQKVTNDILTIINGCIGNKLSTQITDYGDYMTNPLYMIKYDCFGREAEIEDCIQCLCHMKKSNIILVGKPGVGKTSIVYGICNYLQSDMCPDTLRGKVIFSLSVNKLISGTKYRGDLEKRIEDLVDELEKHPDIILFVDEIHCLLSKPGGDDGDTSIQNVLKPYLSRKSMLIGCTTEKEYRIIESDKAFERRFQKIYIKECNKYNTLKILDCVVPQYEKFHGVPITEDMCKYIIEVCDQKIKNRYFPDKALDILDRCCTVAKLQKVELNKEIINRCVSEYSGIKQLFNTDIDSIEEQIKEQILGQDESIHQTCLFIKKYLNKLNNENRPIASLLFVGPTGTGKTELCKQVAKHIFTEESFIRFDMSEFNEPHSISKLIGSPPGYVGYSSGGCLTEKVKNNPFCVILFDEVEKASKDVLNILLQIMDDGRLSDSSGETVDFRNCVIVMTSNLGCKDYMTRNTIGFTQEVKDSTHITKAVKDFFSPEFLGRLDNILNFNPIDKKVFEQILQKDLKEFIERYETSFGIIINVQETAIQHMIDDWFDIENGARFIEKNIDKNLGELFLYSELQSNQIVTISFDGRFVLEVKDEESREREYCEESV